MRTLVHLSDLHFGRSDSRLLQPLVKVTHDMQPDLVVVSGDLTQRARAHQFRAARAFLNELPSPKLVVPGNHDVPLYNVTARFAFPFRNFRRFVNRDLEPLYHDDEIAVCGVNSAYSWTFSDGRIGRSQLQRLLARLDRMQEHLLRVVVCHHPFDAPRNTQGLRIVHGARRTIEAMAGAGVDMVLSGHFHMSHIGHAVERYRVKNHSFLLVHAGTATSTRMRGETNAFNVIKADSDTIEIQRYWWNVEQEAFERVLTENYAFGKAGWHAADPSTAASTIEQPVAD